MQIDSHAHQLSKYTQIIVGVHTLGVHPWELVLPFNREAFDLKWNELIKRKSGIYAIGECGLDRIHENITDIENQKYVLLKHFDEARKRKIPLIIHSVRTYSDILSILKKNKLSCP